MFNYNYDPQRQGYDTGLWKTLSGTPVEASNKLRFNNASAIQYGDNLRGDFKFNPNILTTPTNGFLTGGSSATAVIGTWQAVTDGEFTITINDDILEVTGLDFSGASDMDDVATIIQTGINALVGEGEDVTVVWSTDHFVITGRSGVSVTSIVSGGSGTDISGVGATPFMDCETGQGTPTAGSDKTFGLTQLSSGAKAVFRVFGAQLRLLTISEAGGETITDLPWVASWDGSEVTFRLSWSGQSVSFLIAREQVGVHSDDNNPRTTMSLFVDNNDADNLDFGIFDAEGVETYL